MGGRMTVKEYIDAVVKLSDEHAEAVDRLKKKLKELSAGIEEQNEPAEPTEPLIKDEKIRKAVRAWYDAIDYRIDNLLCIKTSGNTRLEISDGSPKLIYISLFVDKGTLANIKDRTYYTIAELCGEEEE